VLGDGDVLSPDRRRISNHRERRDRRPACAVDDRRPGALIEGSTGLANPSLTIAALTERCMSQILPRLHDDAGDDEDD
jgi:hypothetical protein